MKIPDDTLNKFLFKHAPIRGEIVHLDQSWQSVLDRHDYPDVLRDMMGELCAAAVLLAATLKLQGSLVLQIHGKGAIKLLVVECTGNLGLRATAKWEGELLHRTLKELVGDGRFVITLETENNDKVYQGVVALEGGSIADILQNYMTRSEQLETHLCLAADGQRAAGMLLQKLPEKEHPDADAWSRAVQLTETLKHDELMTLPAPELLRRLFYAEEIILFDKLKVAFFCACSRNSVSRMLKLLGKQEVNEILAERDEVEVFCEFCNQRYLFDAIDAEEIFSGSTPLPGKQTLH